MDIFGMSISKRNQFTDDIRLERVKNNEEVR